MGGGTWEVGSGRWDMGGRSWEGDWREEEGADTRSGTEDKEIVASRSVILMTRMFNLFNLLFI